MFLMSMSRYPSWEFEFRNQLYDQKEGGTEPIVLAESIYAGYDMRIKRSVPIPDEVRRLIENFEATPRWYWRNTLLV